jgi:hypothetical protein
MVKYAELVTKSAEQRKLDNLELLVEEQKASVDLKEIKLKQAIASLTLRLNTLQGQLPLCIDSIIDATDEKDYAERRLKVLQAIKADLFTERK